MPQLISLASAQAPWLLPAVGIALFIHKHFLSFKQADNQLHARVRAGARSRPPKLKRKGSKANTNNTQDIQDVRDHEQEQLDAAGLGHDKLMEWFTEDEVEALHQAQANSAALLSLLTGNRFTAMEYEDESEWSTEEGLDPGLSSHFLKPLEPLQDSSSRSPMSAAASDQHDLSFQRAVQQHLEQQQAVSEESQQQHLQSQLAQQLFLQLAKAELLQAEQQQQQQKPGSLQPPTAAAASTPRDAAAVGPTAISSASGDPVSDCEDGGDYFDPNDYFALSPAAATAGPHLPSPSPGRFLPRTGALWAASYPPRLGEDLGDDFEPDFEPDLGDLDWDFDAPDFDPGYEPDFGDEDLVFDVEGLGHVGTEYTAPVAAAVTQVVQA